MTYRPKRQLVIRRGMTAAEWDVRILREATRSGDFSKIEGLATFQGIRLSDTEHQPSFQEKHLSPKFESPFGRKERKG